MYAAEINEQASCTPEYHPNPRFGEAVHPAEIDYGLSYKQFGLWSPDSGLDMSSASDVQGEVCKSSIEIGMNQKLYKPVQGTPLHIAAALGHMTVTQTLVRHRADVNAVDKAGLSPLHYATRNGHTEVMEELLKNGADVDSLDADGCTPLYRAAETGNNAMVERLLSHGARLR
ncbi:hypothetical protein KVR01_009541 [Diaporthe batatas]|uniref:uncharacterized protein n=1 Tax=Diaporthe batatas TaxID=748121 RepID=UPI001D05533E|nr:uncharacterized protein KVR01_009541 [Diaporthe batatas]KAG8161277.1 hypothetical protein KVR01_009541 [Diaporthe batatas]